MPVSISREGVKHPVRPLSTDARALLKALGIPKGELSVVLCDDPFIQQLNEQWRGKNETTDVLSFAMNEGEDADLHPELLGDIVISLDTATRQGAAIGHGLDQELRVLLVHGLCHLLGYDHLEEPDATEMRAKEAELLAVLGEPARGLVSRAGVVEADGPG